MVPSLQSFNGRIETHHVETPLMEFLPKTKNTNLLLGNTYETARQTALSSAAQAVIDNK